MFDMEFVLDVSFDVHVARVPVAVFWLALRAPMCPDAEFGVAKPLGYFVLSKRLPVRLELAGRYRLGTGANRGRELRGSSYIIGCKAAAYKWDRNQRKDDK